MNGFRLEEEFENCRTAIIIVICLYHDYLVVVDATPALLNVIAVSDGESIFFGVER